MPPSLLALSLLRVRRIARSSLAGVTSVLILANARLRMGSLDIPAENAVVSTRLSCAFATSGGESSYNRRRLSGRMLRVWSTGGTGRRTGCCRALGDDAREPASFALSVGSIKKSQLGPGGGGEDKRGRGRLNQPCSTTRALFKRFYGNKNPDDDWPAFRETGFEGVAS